MGRKNKKSGVERVKKVKAENFQGIEENTWTFEIRRLVKSACLSCCDSPSWKIKGLIIIRQKKDKKNCNTKRKEQFLNYSLIFQFLIYKCSLNVSQQVICCERCKDEQELTQHICYTPLELYLLDGQNSESFMDSLEIIR